MLFDVNHPKYHLKDVTEQALKAIRNSLIEQGINASVKQVHTLRTYFCKERGKVTFSKQSCAGTDQIYVSKWKFYERLCFLSDYISPRNTVSNLKSSLTTESLVSLPFAKSQRILTNKRLEKTEKLMETAVEYLRTPTTNNQSTAVIDKDDDDVFAEIVSRLMRKLPDGEEKDLLKISIQHMITCATYKSRAPNISPSMVTNRFRSPCNSPYNTPSPSDASYDYTRH